MLATFPWLKHRTFSHSLLSIFVIYFLLKEIESIINISHISFFATLGYASHTFLGDLFTKQGVPLFYPISNKKISFGCFKVGSYVCNLAEIITILILLGLIFFSIIII
jgi:inner membrane protein